MAKNPYFKYQSSEPALMEELIIESIKVTGDDYIYIAREDFDRDYLFGEDINSKFKDSAIIEMYLKNYESHNGSELFSRFGLELKDRITVIVSKKRFEEAVTSAFTEIKRPREGDLIYSPITYELYEIEFVDNEAAPYYQGNRNFTYEITAQTYQHNQEEIETGMENIDSIATNSKELLTYIGLTGGITGEFLINETVYVGSAPSSASFSGVVTNWSELTPKQMYLKDTEGDVASVINSVLKGEESGAQAIVGQNMGNTMDHITINPFANNDEIQKESRTIIDFSEVDPFSEGNY
jgi:hypothetical protein